MADFGSVTPHLGRYVDGTGLDTIGVVEQNPRRAIKDSAAANTIYYFDGAFLCQNVYGGAITSAEVTDGTFENIADIALNSDSSRLYFVYFKDNNNTIGDMYLNYILTSDMSTFGTPLDLSGTSYVNSAITIDKDGWAWIIRYIGSAELLCVNLADNTILRDNIGDGTQIVAVNKDSEFIAYSGDGTKSSYYGNRNISNTAIELNAITTPYTSIQDFKFTSDGKIVIITIPRTLYIRSGATFQTEDSSVVLPTTASDAMSVSGLMIGLNGDVYIGWHDLGDYGGGGSISVAFYKYDSNLSNREILSTAVAPFGTMIDMNGYVHRTVTRGL